MRTKKNAINIFLNQKEIAVVGASRNKQKYGYLAFHLLQKNNYIVYPVNPNINILENVTCFPNITSLPESVTAAFIITPKNQTASAVNEAILKGIRYIWIQCTAETSEAIKIAENNKINLVKHECLFMFIESNKIQHDCATFLLEQINSIHE